MLEEINVRGELLIEFANKNEWIRKCPHYLPKKTSAYETWLWVDSRGNIADVDEDFESAAIHGTYPIKVYKLQRISKVKSA